VFSEYFLRGRVSHCLQFLRGEGDFFPGEGGVAPGASSVRAGCAVA
jgi:hypothetical protein